MERRLNTPLKFRHPCYEALTWFAARNYLQEVRGESSYVVEVSLSCPVFISSTSWSYKMSGLPSRNGFELTCVFIYLFIYLFVYLFIYLLELFVYK